MAVADRSLLVQRMQNSGTSIKVPEGGRWGAEERQKTVLGAVGIYGSAFKQADTVDPAVIHWITQLQNIITQSYTEQSAYDFKQGFLRLDGTNAFDDGSFEKILQTCAGIANIRKGAKGYVLVGVADKATTAARVQELYGATPLAYEGFFIVGVEHEARCMKKNLDQLFQIIVDKIKSSKLSTPLKDFIARHIKPVRYYDKTVYVFEVEAQEDPSSYDGKYFVRHGAQLEEIPPENLAALIRRYIMGL